MHSLRVFFHRLAGFFGAGRSDAEFEDELQQHIDLQTADNIARGMTPTEARRQALIDLGGMAATREAYHRQRGLPALESFVADIRYTFRMLRKELGFTTVAVLTLALGIGCSTAVFSIAHAVLMREAPYPDSDRIVLVWGAESKDRTQRSQVSHTDIEDVRARNRVFTALANFADWTPTLSGNGEPERLNATQVSDGFFDVIGIKPFLGREFSKDEHIDGRDRVVILSYPLWKNRFNSDPNILGKAIVLSSSPHIVVGVMPPELEALPSTLVQGGQLYRPVGENYDDTQRSGHHLRAIARLKPGVTVKQANEDVNRVAAELRAEHPVDDFDLYYNVVGLQADTADNFRSSVMLLTYAVLALLLIACSNVAGLLLARGAARQKEFAVRTALGASRMRVVRQGLTESLVLAAIGGFLGIGIAFACARLSVLFAPKMGSPLAHVALDPQVLFFAAAATFLTAVMFGVVPAVQSASSNLAESLKQGGQRSEGSGGGKKFHAVVVTTELALALMVLTCAALLVNGFIKLQRVNVGFDPHDRLQMNVWISYQKYNKPEQQIAFFSELMRQVQNMPGVTSAALTDNQPMGGYDGRGILPEGKADVPENKPSPQAYSVTVDYLKTMGIPLLRGRNFEPTDNEKSAPVVLLSKDLAEQIFPGEEPLGKKIQMQSGLKDANGKNVWRTVVGIVGDVMQLGPDGRKTPGFYMPYQQFPVTGMTLIVHAPHAQPLVAPLRRIVNRMDPDVAVFRVQTYEETLSDALMLRRVAMLLITAFGAIALFLAAVGLYGLMAYVVSRRQHEFGVRSALGAQRADILKLVLGSGLRLVAIGSVIGLGCSFAATRVIGSALDGLGSPDAKTLGSAFAVLITAGLIANFIPAVNAANVDPALPLRGE